MFERTPRSTPAAASCTARSIRSTSRPSRSERVIAAHDARLDPRTSAFTEAYLIPFGVTSMLDAPIRRLGQTAGVICFEHTGPRAPGRVEDENFATSIADLVAMAIDATERRQAQEALRHRVEFEKLIASISTRFAQPRGRGARWRDRGDARGRSARSSAPSAAHVFMLLDDGLSAHIAYEWNAAGVESRKQAYGELPGGVVPVVDRQDAAAATSPVGVRRTTCRPRP